MTRNILILCVALILTGCTSRLTIPPVNVQTPTGLTPIPGNFAATIQTGGWALKVDPQGMNCAIMSFNADINAPYESAMRDVLTKSVGKITFVPGALSPEQLQKNKYDAQITIYQGNADSKLVVVPALFSATANSDIVLTTTLAITDKTGLVYQYSPIGKGSGAVEVHLSCPAIGEAVAKAGQSAVQEIVQNTALYIREGLRDWETKKMAKR
ncbi:MAG: hypothetical protein WBK91_06040 [Alphaproteobacteria bacterium]